MSIDPVLNGADYQIVQRVFKRISRTVWFRDDITTLNKFGRAVLTAYQSGITDPEELHAHCLLVAKVMLPPGRSDGG